MNVLVANPTYHNYQFHYRVPELMKPLVAEVPPGSQVQLIPHDMNDIQLKEVVKQLERYGAVPESDVDNLRSPRSLVFSIRRPMTSDTINEARENDERMRQQVSEQETENAGVATIPTVLPKPIQEAMRVTQQNSTLHVEQIENLEGERAQAVKGGVNTTITVSKKAGPRERKNG